jgi:MarR family transcriptional regulator for hemolysin
MPSQFNPEEGIGFLLVDVSRLMRRDFDRRVRDLGLTQAQWRAIAHLARDEGINQTVLAERLEVQPITLARLVDRMEAAGWVKRRADPDDRRAMLLFLTPKAQPILKTMIGHAADALKDLMKGVSRSEHRTLIKALTRMKDNLTATDADAGSRTRTGNGSGGRHAAGRR